MTLSFSALLSFTLFLGAEEGGSQWLLRQLNDDAGWELKETLPDGRHYYEKNLPGLDLVAVETAQKIDFKAKHILKSVEDVSRYGEFLTSADAMECTLLRENANVIFGYQYLSIPLVSDRHYVFKMRRQFVSAQGNEVVDWVLIPQDSEFKKIITEGKAKNSSLVYLDKGAGVWRVRRDKDGALWASYRLYMDPGGWIPDAIVRRANKSGLLNLFADAIVEAKRRAKSDTAKAIPATKSDSP